MLAIGLGLALLRPQTFAQGVDKVSVGTVGNKVQVNLTTGAPDQEYILETQAKVLEGAEWEPLLRFRGSPTPRPFVDALCGTLESRFFRLRKLLDAPPVEVSDFRLIDTDGNARELYYQRSGPAVAVLLVGTNAASAITFGAELDRVRTLAGITNLPTWVVCASDVTNREALAEIAKGLPPGIPILQDTSHAVHRTLGSGRAPEIVLIATEDWSIAYRGPVDETVDTGREVLKSHPYAAAASELLSGQPVSVSRMGNIVGLAGIKPVIAADYARDIAPLFIQSCMPCHEPGNIAPWSMTNYATIVQLSRLMKSSVLAGEMPPWHADPKHQVFANSKALTPDQISMLVDWIDRGTPRGAGPDPLPQAVQPSTDVWPLGTPDAIVSIASQSIPASGVIDYKYMFAASPFATDVWLRAVAVKPGNREVVHHCLVFKGTTAELLALQGGLSGFFAGYVPGMEQVAFPAGTGKLLKRTDAIVFQMHYTTSGKATTDRTQLGFYLAPVKPAREIITGSAYNNTFSIPPMQPKTPVSASKTFAKKSLIYELSPHMHFRGNSARYTLIYPDGKREILLNVPDYFFNWQALYRLQTPKEVPAGTQLICEGSFDNSPYNKYNPDPASTVAFGEQSWQEMFIGYVNYSEIP